MRVKLAVLLSVFLFGCSASEQTPGPGSDDSIANKALGLYSSDGTRLVVYIAAAGDPKDVLTPENLAKMDAGEIVGTPWTRIEVPADLGSFDLAAVSGSSFRHESFTEHPYTGETVPILLDFEAGESGLQGSINVTDDGELLNTSFSVEFMGDYTLFPEIGPKWLEFRISQSAIVADDPEAP